MKTAKWLVIAAAAGFLATGGLFTIRAHTAEKPTPEGRLKGQFLQRAKQKLGLTDEQVTKIKAELKVEKDTLSDLISQLHEARVGLRQAIQATDANETSVRAASAKVAAAEADLAVERLKLHGRISPLLTPEQREKVMEFQTRLDDFLDNRINHLGDRL